jgi:hypothetical protein
MQSQRISIHAGNIEESYRPHPTWMDENDHELDACPFAETENEAASELHELNALIERFLDRAPSDANAEIRIHKTVDGRYDAHIDVHSSQRSFGPVHRLGYKFRDVVECLVEEMRDEIEEWKRNRNLNVGDGL